MVTEWLLFQYQGALSQHWCLPDGPRGQASCSQANKLLTNLFLIISQTSGGLISLSTIVFHHSGDFLNLDHYALLSSSGGLHYNYTGITSLILALHRTYCKSLYPFTPFVQVDFWAK